MGTNYYLIRDQCSHCGRGNEPKHIGKSSFGWYFGLRIYPDEGINDLPDWHPLIKDPNAIIRDEYGKTIKPNDMIGIITEIDRGDERPSLPIGYMSWQHFHDINQSEDANNGLVRHKVGQFCHHHGDGTWDCIARDFS